MYRDIKYVSNIQYHDTSTNKYQYAFSGYQYHYAVILISIGMLMKFWERPVLQDVEVELRSGVDEDAAV